MDIEETGINMIGPFCIGRQADSAAFFKTVRHVAVVDVAEIAHRLRVVDEIDEAVDAVAHDEVAVVAPAKPDAVAFLSEACANHWGEIADGQHGLSRIDVYFTLFGYDCALDVDASNLVEEFRFAIAPQVVSQRAEPLLHGGKLLSLQCLCCTLRVLDFRRYGAHALLAVVEIVDEVAYTAFQMAIDDFCHNVKL